MLQIYNTLTKQKEVFVPLHPPKVGLYVCGITVYDFCHIGHARAYLVFDMILRYLRHRKYEVKYIRNITDIDDKIIKRAQENKETCDTLTARFIKAMHDDFDHLGLLPADLEPRATEYIAEMIGLIQILIDKNYAYVGETGDVYYAVEQFKTYGCLSHRNIEDLKSGARVEVNEAKRNPLDFVLWKMAKPGEPKWPSPWGEGRPGWHIECSVMSMKNLGETFDIHGGGPDLIFPHHENERAQSVAATDKPFVNIWMHAGYLQINKEKMSKSLKNFLTIQDFLKQYPGEVLRYFMLASHYRSPMDYSLENLEPAVSALERFYTCLRGVEDLDKIKPLEHSPFEARFEEAMDDDFNTPVALAVLFDLAREINREREQNIEQAKPLAALLKKLAGILGLLKSDPVSFLQGAKAPYKAENASGMSNVEIEKLIAMREHARKTKDWKEADRLRTVLKDAGIELEDTATGTLWRRT